MRRLWVLILIRTPFAWTPRPAPPAARPAGRPIARYFEQLLSWESGAPTESAPVQGPSEPSRTAALGAEPLPSDRPVAPVEDAAPAVIVPIESLAPHVVEIGSLAPQVVDIAALAPSPEEGPEGFSGWLRRLS